MSHTEREAKVSLTTVVSFREAQLLKWIIFTIFVGNVRNSTTSV
jgi:hypothetical protein